MRWITAKNGSRCSWVAVLGILCVVLVLFASVLSVAHSHASGHPDPDCSLCMAAHQVAQAVVVIAVEVSTQPVVRLIVEYVDPLPRQRFVMKLANRPPPAVSAFA